MLNTETLALVTILGTIVGAVWGLDWWLSGQFANIRRLVYDQIDKLNHMFAEKLEYHQKHDDVRFEHVDNRLTSVRNDIWEIRVRNAAKEGISPTKLRKQDEEE